MTITDQIKKLVLCDVHSSDIYEKLKCSRSLISRVRTRCGKSKFKSGPRVAARTKERRKIIVEMKLSGFTYFAIAKAIKISPTRVFDILMYNAKKGPGLARCPDCGNTSRLQRHHINYAYDATENLCLSCHKRKDWVRERQLRGL